MLYKSGALAIVGVSLLLMGGFFFLSTKKVIFISEKNGVSPVSPLEGDSLVEAKRVSPTILFGGDMMFDRYLRTLARKRPADFFFEPLLPLLESVDLAVANLEGPITDNASVSETSVIGSRENYIFTFDHLVAALLRRVHIGVVNIGNNHILNFKEDGVVQTKKYLSLAGVDFFGSPLPDDDRTIVKEIHDTTIALVNYNEFVWRGKEKALADIAKGREEADVVVLYAHWGKEYVPAVPAVKDLAHQFVDAGVDVVIGSHPHVVQEKEVYRGKTIYYSLGNLIFDQYQEEATMRGLLVKMTIDGNTKTLSFEDIPIMLKPNGQVVLDK